MVRHILKFFPSPFSSFKVETINVSTTISESQLVTMVMFSLMIKMFTRCLLMFTWNIYGFFKTAETANGGVL